MKNLESYGVQELTSSEMTKVEGGWIDRIIYGIGALVLAALNTDWDAAANDFSRGFKDAH